VTIPDSATPVFEPLLPVEGRRLLLKGGMILSMDAEVGDLVHGDLLIEGDRIAAIGHGLEADEAEVIDASNMVLLPGFVDCHRHCWEAQLRHLNPNSDNLLDYCCATHLSFAPHYRPGDIRAGTLLSAAGAIDCGITTVIDNAHNSRTDAHALAGLAAWDEAGVRVVYAVGAPASGDWDEDGWPDRRLAGLIEALRQAGTPLVSLAVMAQFTPEVWSCARSRGLPIVSEIHSPELAPVIRALAEAGQLGPDNLFNHITALAPDVLEILRRAGVRVNVCPRADAQYGIGDGGMGSFQAACDAGLRPGFSVDNETAYSGDMFGEMRTEFFLQRAMAFRERFAGDSNAPIPMSVRRALEAATVDGARCAGLEDRVGRLAPGMQADLIAIRLTDRNLAPLNNVIGAVVQGADRGNIDTVVIGGRIRKRGGSIVGLDESRLAGLAAASRDYLFASYGYRPDPFCDGHPVLLQTEPLINRYWA